MKKTAVWLGVAVGTLVLAGCTTYRDSNTARTPEEQMLLSKATDYSIGQVDLSKVAGAKVFLDAASLECVDKAYVVDALKQALAANGGKVMEKADGADLVVTVRSAMLASQFGNGLFGIPSLKMPSPMTAGTLETPELALFKRVKQDAFAKLCISGYSRATNELVFAGEGVARTRYTRWIVLVIFQFDTTNVPELDIPVYKKRR